MRGAVEVCSVRVAGCGREQPAICHPLHKVPTVPDKGSYRRHHCVQRYRINYVGRCTYENINKLRILYLLCMYSQMMESAEFCSNT